MSNKKTTSNSIGSRPLNSIMSDSLTQATSGDKSIKRETVSQKPVTDKKEITNKAEVEGKSKVIVKTTPKVKNNTKTINGRPEENMGNILIDDINSFNPFNQFTKEFFNTVVIDFSALGKNGKNTFKEVIGTNQKAEVKSKVLIYILNRFISNIASDSQAYESIINLVINEPYLQGNKTVKSFLNSIEYSGKKGDEKCLREFLKKLQTDTKNKKKEDINIKTTQGIIGYIHENFSSTNSISQNRLKNIKTHFNQLPVEEKRLLLENILSEKYYLGGRLNYITLGSRLKRTFKNTPLTIKKDSEKIGNFLLNKSDALKISTICLDAIIRLFINENLKK